MSVRYIWDVTQKKKRLHIQAYDAMGRPRIRAVCGFVPHYSPRTINAPFTLGLPICKHCLKIAGGAA